MAKPQAREPSTGALFNRMQAAVSQGRLSEAADVFDRQQGRGSPPTTLLRARVYLKKREYARAIEFLNDANLSDWPRAHDAERLMLLGIAHSRTNRFTEADEYFQRASSGGQELIRSGELAYWRGRRYLEERRPLDAELH